MKKYIYFSITLLICGFACLIATTSCDDQEEFSSMSESEAYTNNVQDYKQAMLQLNQKFAARTQSRAGAIDVGGNDDFPDNGNKKVNDTIRDAVVLADNLGALIGGIAGGLALGAAIAGGPFGWLALGTLTGLYGYAVGEVCSQAASSAAGSSCNGVMIRYTQPNSNTDYDVSLHFPDGLGLPSFMDSIGYRHNLMMVELDPVVRNMLPQDNFTAENLIPIYDEVFDRAMQKYPIEYRITPNDSIRDAILPTLAEILNMVKRVERGEIDKDQYEANVKNIVARKYNYNAKIMQYLDMLDVVDAEYVDAYEGEYTTSIDSIIGALDLPPEDKGIIILTTQVGINSNLCWE